MNMENEVNIKSLSCLRTCRRTVATAHPSGVGDAPPGDVRRCQHGKYWFRPVEVHLGGAYIWTLLSRVGHPVIYMRARRAFKTGGG